MSKPRTIKAIKNLIEKGIVKKVQRGLTKTNLYTLSDYATMWTCDNIEDVAEAADNQGVKPLTPEQHIAEQERMGYTVQIKEKELETAPTKAQNQAHNLKKFDIVNTIDNFTTNSRENQDRERYTIDQIKQLFDYDFMLQEHPDLQPDIDSVINVLHTAMNICKPIIRIAGQDKPAMVVIGKLMKLDKESIMYAIRKFSEQTERIKNPAAYLLTILYNAPEQYYLDMKNQTAYDNAPKKQVTNQKQHVNQKPIDIYTSFPQREYDYESLEKELLNKDIAEELELQEQLKNLSGK